MLPAIRFGSRPRALALGLFLLASACGDETGRPRSSDGGAGGAGGGGGSDDFDDHTLRALTSREDFDRLAAQGAQLSTVKLIVTEPASDERRAVRFLSSDFYALHDEWYWFRLLNGAPVPGVDTPPAEGLSFTDVASVYAWAREQIALPLDLQWVGPARERLYSPRFYAVALGPRPRALDVATLVHVPARTGDAPRPERFAFELEYADEPDHAALARTFELLAAHLPAELGGELHWLVRSAAQEALARRMETERLAYHDRILRYAELSEPGAVEVYAPGLTAGRLRLVRAGEPLLSGASATDVLVTEEVPDLLPACAALITAVPQTPLAHIAVLSRNRGIPDAYLGGATDDAELVQLAAARAPVVVRATPPDRLELVAITEDEYARYRSLLEKEPIEVEPPDLDALPLTYDLSTLSLADVEALRPVIGGKASGFLALLAPGTTTLPPELLSITIRPFVEHLAPLLPRIRPALEDLQVQRSALLRHLVLEGEAAFDAAHPDAAAQEVKRAFLESRTSGDAARDVVRDGGVQGLIEAAPIAPDTLAALRAALQEHFGAYAVEQGLRFRSSSNVEDLEGFNGAGLYDSATGYLDAAAQPTEKRRARTIEHALRRTWASYFAFEAHEERRLERVNHFSGAMGVVVHASFADELELANGVITFTKLPDGGAANAVMEVNAQLGAVSVTNPEPGTTDLPEVARVVLDAGAGEPRIERVRPSTLLPPGDTVLEDGALRALFAEIAAVEEAWRAQENAALPAAQARRTLTLDLEFRRVAEGWPALAAGAPHPARMILKQARSLEPGLRGVPAGLSNAPLPRDVLARARRIEERSCTAAGLTVRVLEATTDPLRPPDLGHERVPFTGAITVMTADAEPALGLPAGHRAWVTHLSLAQVQHPGLDAGAPWSLSATVAPDAVDAAGFDTITVGADGTLSLGRGEATLERTGACELQVLFSSPEEYLLELLAAGL